MVGVRVIAAMLAAIVLKTVVNLGFSPAVLKEEIHGIASYVELIGGIYSIVIAFLIYVVWEQFNRVQVGLSREAAAMEDLCRVAGFMSVRGAVSEIRGSARRYIDAAVGDEHRHLAKGELTGNLCKLRGAFGNSAAGYWVVSARDCHVRGCVRHYNFPALRGEGHGQSLLWCLERFVRSSLGNCSAHLADVM